jgi:hypothetical protein
VGRWTKQFEESYSNWKRDIVRFAREGFGLTKANKMALTQQQISLLKCVQAETLLPLDQRKKRITVRSGQGTGKTTVSVVIAVWRALWAVDALVVVTAPTALQLKDVWIAEARRLLGRAHPFLKKLVTKVTATRITIGKRETWGIWTRSASRPENFQGYHEKYLTFIIDEASGVDRDIIKTIKGTLTNANSLIIACGNPNQRQCAFFDFFYKPTEAALWHKFVFDSRESEMVDPENIKKLIAEFGEDSDTVRVRVKGEFPLSDPNAVMSSEDLWACEGVPMMDAARMNALAERNVIAIDFARFGSDESVIVRRTGHALVEIRTFSRREPTQIVEEAFAMQRRARWDNAACLYIVDAGGMGQGVLGKFYERSKRVFEFHFGGKASKPDYANRITEAYFNLGRLAKDRRIHLPQDDPKKPSVICMERAVEQLSSRLYGTNGKGKLELEGKDEYVKRLDESPDQADAIVMAFYNGTKIKGRASR